MKKFWVYILRSERDGKYYIGYTGDLETRIRSHNAGMQKSTRSRIPFTLIYQEEYGTKREALEREKQIKSYKGGNAFKGLLNLHYIE